MTNILTVPAQFAFTFTTQAEALEHLTMCGYSRLPVPGPIARYSATLWDDNGVKYLSFASSGRNAAGEIEYRFDNSVPRR